MDQENKRIIYQTAIIALAAVFIAFSVGSCAAKIGAQSTIEAVSRYENGITYSRGEHINPK